MSYKEVEHLCNWTSTAGTDCEQSDYFARFTRAFRFSRILRNANLILSTWILRNFRPGFSDSFDLHSQKRKADSLDLNSQKRKLEFTKTDADFISQNQPYGWIEFWILTFCFSYLSYTVLFLVSSILISNFSSLQRSASSLAVDINLTKVIICFWV